MSQRFSLAFNYLWAALKRTLNAERATLVEVLWSAKLAVRHVLAAFGTVQRHLIHELLRRPMRPVKPTSRLAQGTFVHSLGVGTAVQSRLTGATVDWLEDRLEADNAAHEFGYFLRGFIDG